MATLTTRINDLAVAVRTKLNTISTTLNAKLDASAYVRGLSVFCSGKPGNAEVIGGGIAPYAFTISASNSSFKALVASTSGTVITIKKNGVQIGTATFAASATLASMSFSSTTVTAGDALTFHNQATADATLADISGIVRA